MLRAGTLNRDVEIRRLDAGRDAVGQSLDAWVHHAHVRANVRHLNGVQTIKADTPTSVLQVSMRVRYRTDIDASMRAMYLGKAYQIKAAIPDEVNREYVDLVCEVLP